MSGMFVSNVDFFVAQSVPHFADVVDADVIFKNSTMCATKPASRRLRALMPRAFELAVPTRSDETANTVGV